MWLAPPAMNSCTTRFAFAGWWRPPAASAPSRPSRAARAAGAMPPSPPPECHRNSRRERMGFSLVGPALPDVLSPPASGRAGPTSVHEHELIEVQDHPAGVRQAVLPGVCGQCVALGG